MKRFLMFSLLGLSILVITSFTSQKSMEIPEDSTFTLSWDVSGGKANIIVNPDVISLLGLEGTGSSVLDVDPGAYTITIEAATGYRKISHAIDTLVNELKITVVVAPV